MGVSITAFVGLKLVRPLPAEPKDSDWEHGDKEVALYSIDFPERADGMVDGIYSFEDKKDGFHYSYGGYHAFRQALARAVGIADLERWWKTNPADDVAFFELLQFADNEGFWGPRSTANLAADFKALKHELPRDGDLYSLPATVAAFAYAAANDGVVSLT